MITRDELAHVEAGTCRHLPVADFDALTVSGCACARIWICSGVAEIYPRGDGSWQWGCRRDCNAGGIRATAQLASVAGEDHAKTCDRPMPVRDDTPTS